MALKSEIFDKNKNWEKTERKRQQLLPVSFHGQSSQLLSVSPFFNLGMFHLYFISSSHDKSQVNATNDKEIKNKFAFETGLADKLPVRLKTQC